MVRKKLRILALVSLVMGVGCGDPAVDSVPLACGETRANMCEVSDDDRLVVQTLEGLESVCEDACSEVARLTFLGLDSLEVLEGFQWLKRVEIQMRVSDLGTVRTLDGFDNLEFVGGMTIENNFRLNEINSFANLKEVWQLKLRQMDGVDSIRAFDEVEYLGPADDLTRDFGFFLISMDGITHLEGLHKVREAGIVAIQYNENLETMDIMDSVEEIRSLSIRSNPKLSSLGEWPNLRRAHWGIEVYDTPNLRRCEVEAWLDQLEERPENVELSGLSDAPCD